MKCSKVFTSTVGVKEYPEKMNLVHPDSRIPVDDCNQIPAGFHHVADTMTKTILTAISTYGSATL